MQILDIHKLSFSYGEEALIDNFSLTLKKGEKCVLSAPSGKGKSTLLKLILGLESSDIGDITVCDVRLGSDTVSTIRKNIAYVSQGSDLPEMCVSDLIEWVFSFKANRHIEFDIKAFHDLKKCFNLNGDLLSKETESLSGGEAQRVSLILALLLERELLLLDEPTSALDKKTTAAVVDYLEGLDLTLLVVSHGSEFFKKNSLFKKVSL